MPTYAYRCPKCAHEFEKVQRITEPGGARCPVCRSAAKRVITGGGGLIFKGSGFYLTDYRSESYKKGAEQERSGAGTGSEKSGAGPSSEKPVTEVGETKGDAKPERREDSKRVESKRVESKREESKKQGGAAERSAEAKTEASPLAKKPRKSSDGTDGA